MTHTFLFLFLLCAHALLPSLPPETLIQTPDGLVQIQNLKSGNNVLGFDLETNQHVATKIISISRLTVRKSVKVTTDSDVFEISDDQLVRIERVRSNQALRDEYGHEKLFIPAWFISPGDLLQSNNSSQKCVRIEQISNCEKPFYELHLANPHHFFATEQHILMHNVIEGSAIVYVSTGAAESGLGSIISRASEAIAGPIVGLLVLFGTAVSILYSMKDTPEPAPTIEVKKPELQAPAAQHKMIDLSSRALMDQHFKEQQQLKQQQRSSKSEPAEPTRTPIIANEKDDATQDQIDSEIMRKKIDSIDLISRKILEDELLKGERSSSPDDWFKSGGPGASPPNTNPADSLTFKDWTFLPQAFFGMSAYSLAPRLAVAAIEGALCMAGATVAMPTAVLYGTLCCMRCSPIW